MSLNDFSQMRYVGCYTDLDAFFRCDMSDILICVCYVRVIDWAYNMSSTHEKIRLLIAIINNVDVRGLGAFVDIFMFRYSLPAVPKSSVCPRHILRIHYI